MTKLLPTLGALAIVLGTSQAQATESGDNGTLGKIAQTRTITLGHRESAVPFAYLNTNNQVIGYSHDLTLKVIDKIKAQLKLTDLKEQWIPITAQNRIPYLLNGNIDIECGATTNTAERREKVAFSNTLFIAGVRLMARKDSKIKDFPDLAGKNVVTTRGTTSESLLLKMNKEQKARIKLIQAKEHGEAFLALEQGKAVAFVMDDVLLAGERAKAAHPDDWAILGTPQTREAYGCILRKDDAPFKKLVDEALTQAMQSGEAEALYKKWFESPIPPNNVNLAYPLSEDMRALFNEPSDQGFDQP